MRIVALRNRPLCAIVCHWGLDFHRSRNLIASSPFECLYAPESDWLSCSQHIRRHNQQDLKIPSSRPTSAGLSSSALLRASSFNGRHNFASSFSMSPRQPFFLPSLCLESSLVDRGCASEAGPAWNQDYSPSKSITLQRYSGDLLVGSYQ
jgi:hypothetical protein